MQVIRSEIHAYQAVKETGAQPVFFMCGMIAFYWQDVLR
jgi:hypothetical protein